MEHPDLRRQYNQIADQFGNLSFTNDNIKKAETNKNIFYSHLDFIKPGMKVLDAGCGNGRDIKFYQKLGANVTGIDASEKMVIQARHRVPEATIHVGLLEEMPFGDNSFDAIVSKYAIQTSISLLPIFKEIHRVLKKNGKMLYLVTHPFRQYFERKESRRNYFEQRIVESNIFQKQVTILEPTHTMNEYLNSFLFTNFDVQLFEEHWEPEAEDVHDGDKYPGFFILKAVKQ